MKKNSINNLYILTALIFGIVIGCFPTPFIHQSASIISDLFLNMLKLISLPMVFLAIVSTLTRMSSLSEATFLIKKILKYTLITTLIAASIGLILFVLIDPVNPENSSIAAFTPDKKSYISFLTKIIPSNLIEPFIENNVLGMAFIATILGISTLSLPEKKAVVLQNFFGALFDCMLKITSALIAIMPIGIFAFTIQLIENIRMESNQLKILFLYGICVVSANILQGFVVLPLILKLKGQSPKKVAKGMLPALIMAFFTKSSNGTLPLTIECSKTRLGTSEKTASFSLPLCSIINMNGCAAFILITVFFICSSEGLSFTTGEMIPWIFISTIAAIGNAGVPMGCFFLTTALLVGIGVPIKKMGIILPLYSLFDMVETALNVWSDSCITTLVDQEVKEKKSNLAIVESN